MANGAEGAESVGPTVEVNRSVEAQNSESANRGKEEEAFRGFVDDVSERSFIPTEISSPGGDSVGHATEANDIASFVSNGITSANEKRPGKYFGAANTHRLEATESELFNSHEETDGADTEAVSLQSEDFDTSMDDENRGEGNHHEQSRPEKLEESMELATSQLQSEERASSPMYESEGIVDEQRSAQTGSAAENEDERSADQGELSADRYIRNEISPGPQTTEDPAVQDQYGTETASAHRKPADEESTDFPSTDAEDADLTSDGSDRGGIGDEAVLAESSNSAPESLLRRSYKAALLDETKLARPESSEDETPASDASETRGEADKAVDPVQGYDVLAQGKAKEETVEKFSLPTDVEAGDVDGIPLQDNLTKEGSGGEILPASAKATDIAESVARQANGKDEVASIPEREISPFNVEDKDTETPTDNEKRYTNEEVTADEAPATTDPGMHQEFSNEKIFDESNEEAEAAAILEHVTPPLTVEDEGTETYTDNEGRHFNEEIVTDEVLTTTDLGFHAVEDAQDVRSDPVREEFSNENSGDESNEEDEVGAISEHANPPLTVEDEDAETSTDYEGRHSSEDFITDEVPTTADSGIHAAEDAAGVGHDPLREGFRNEKMVDESHDEGEVGAISEHASVPLTVEDEDAEDVGQGAVREEFSNEEGKVAAISEHAIPPVTVGDEDAETSTVNEGRHSNEAIFTDEVPTTSDRGVHAAEDAEDVGQDLRREEFSNEKMVDESHEEDEVGAISEHATAPFTVEDEVAEASTDNEGRPFNEEMITDKMLTTTYPGVHAVEDAEDVRQSPVRDEFGNEETVNESNGEGEVAAIPEHAIPPVTVEDEDGETSTNNEGRSSNDDSITDDVSTSTDPGIHAVEDAEDVGPDPVPEELSKKKLVDESKEENEVAAISEHAIPPVTVEDEDAETTTVTEGRHSSEEFITDEVPTTTDPGIHTVEDAEDVGPNSVHEESSNMADESDSKAGAEENKGVPDLANTDVTNKDRLEYDLDSAHDRGDELHFSSESAIANVVSSPVFQEDRNWDEKVSEETRAAPEFEYADASAVRDVKDKKTASVSEEPGEDARADYEMNPIEDPHALQNVMAEIPEQHAELFNEYSFESKLRPDSRFFSSAEDAESEEILQSHHEEDGKGHRLALGEPSTAGEATAAEDDGKHFELFLGDEDNHTEGVEHVVGMHELGMEPSETAADPNATNINDALTSSEKQFREHIVTEPPVLAGEDDGVDGPGDKDVSSTFEGHLEQPPTQEDEVKIHQALLDGIPSDEGRESSSHSSNEEATNLEQDLGPSAVASSVHGDEDTEVSTADSKLLPDEKSSAGGSPSDAALLASAVVEDEEASPGPPEEFASVETEANELVSGNSPASEATPAAAMGKTAEVDEKSAGPDEMFAKADTERNDMASEEKLPSEKGTPADGSEGIKGEEKSAGPGEMLADADVEENESVSKESSSKEAIYSDIGETAEVEETPARSGEHFSDLDTGEGELISRELPGEEASSTDVGEIAECEEKSAGPAQVFVDADTESNELLPKCLLPEETTPDIGEAVEVKENRISSTVHLDNATDSTTNPIEATAADEGEDVASANFRGEHVPHVKTADEGPTSQEEVSQVKAISEEEPSSPNLVEDDQIAGEFQSEAPRSFGEGLAMDDNVTEELDQSFTAGDHLKESPEAPVCTLREDDAGPVSEEEERYNEDSTEQKISSTDSAGSPRMTDVWVEAPRSHGGPAEDDKETELSTPAPESPETLPVADNKEAGSFRGDKDLIARGSGEEKPSTRADFGEVSAAEDADVGARRVRDEVFEEYAVPPSRESPGAAAIPEDDNDAEIVTEEKELTGEDGVAAERTFSPTELELPLSVEDPSEEDPAPQDEVGEGDTRTKEITIPAGTHSIDDAVRMQNDGDAQPVPGNDLARGKSTEMRTSSSEVTATVENSDEEAPTAHLEITKQHPGTDELSSAASDAEGGDSTMDDQGVGFGTWVSDLSTNDPSMEEDTRGCAPNRPAPPGDEKPDEEAPTDHTEWAKEHTVAYSSAQSNASSADGIQTEDDKDDNLTEERKVVEDEGTSMGTIVTSNSESTPDIESTKEEGAPLPLDKTTVDDRGEDQFVPESGSAEVVPDENNYDATALESDNDAVREKNEDAERLREKKLDQDAVVAEKTAALPADSPTVPGGEVERNLHATELAGNYTPTSESASEQEPGEADFPERVDDAELVVSPGEEDGLAVNTDDELVIKDREKKVEQGSPIQTVLTSQNSEASSGVEDIGEDAFASPRSERAEDTSNDELSSSGATPFHDDKNAELGSDDGKISSEVEADEMRGSAAGLTGGDLQDESQKPVENFGNEGTATDESGLVLESYKAAVSHEDGADGDSGTMNADLTEETVENDRPMTTSGVPSLDYDDERLEESKTSSKALNQASDEPFQTKFASADSAENKKDMDVVEEPAGTTQDRPTEEEINEAADTTGSDVGPALTEDADKEIQPTDESLSKVENRENELPIPSDSAECKDKSLETALAEEQASDQPANDEAQTQDEDLFEAGKGVAGYKTLSVESDGTVPVAEENDGQPFEAREELKGDEKQGSVLKHDNSNSETEEPQERATEQPADSEEAGDVVATYPTDEPCHLIYDDTAPREGYLSPNSVDTAGSKGAPDLDFLAKKDTTVAEPNEAGDPPATPASVSRKEPEVVLDEDDVARRPGALEEDGKEDSDSPRLRESAVSYGEDLNGHGKDADTTSRADGDTQEATQERPVKDFRTSGETQFDPGHLIQEKAPRAGIDDTLKTPAIHISDDNIGAGGEVEMPSDTVSDERIRQTGDADKENITGEEASEDSGNAVETRRSIGTEDADDNAREFANDGQDEFVDPSAANSAAAMPDVEPFPELSIHSSSFADGAEGVEESEGVAKPDQKATTDSGRKAMEEDEASVPLSTHTSDLSSSWVSVDTEDARSMSEESRPSASMRSQSLGSRNRQGSNEGDWRVVSEHDMFDSFNSTEKSKAQDSAGGPSGFLLSVVLWCSQSMGSLFGGSRR